MSRVYKDIIAIVVLGLGVLSAAVPVLADEVLPASCDAQLHDVIRSRAWMEAQREIEVAEKTITKPDLLAYACISDAMDAAKNTDIFADGLSDDVDFLLSENSLTCEHMNQIASAVRCSNVDKDILLADLGTADFRGCSSSATESSNGLIRDDQWDAAAGIVMPSALPRAVDQGGVDQPLSLSEKKSNDSCDTVTPLKVGRSYVADTSQAVVKETFICLPAGCVYDVQSERCATALAGSS